MDLEEIKAVWSEMSDQLEKQKKLTNEIIITMTQERYASKFQKITFYETIGALVCFGMALYILVNFGKLDTWYLVLSGVFTLVCLFVLPILVLSSLNNIKRINITGNTYKETIVRYTKAKNQLLLLQRIGIYLSFALMFAILPVFSKIMNNKDFFLEGQILWWYFPIMAVFLFVFARWGYKCYKSITNSAENILKELE